MAVRILHKRSAVEFKSATGAQLEFGELGLNYHESGPYLQCKDAAGEVVQLGGVYVGDSAPGNELKGAWWLRSADETLFLYDGAKWVSIAGGGGGGGATTVIGGDGIEAVLSSADTYTVSVDLATNSNGLSIVGGKLTADIATTSSLGTVKIGDGIDVDASGEISVDLSGLDVNADLEYVPDGNNAAEITNTAGDNATVPIATDSVAGLFTGDEKQKLAGIEDGAAANQDLGYTADGNNAGTVTITDGTDATVPIVTDTVAGLMTGTQKQKLDGIEAGAQVNDGYSQAESDGRYLRIDAGAPDQTRVSGEATFAELTTHEAGVKVTGGGLFIDNFPEPDQYGNASTAYVNDIFNEDVSNDYSGFRVDLDVNNNSVGRNINHFISGKFNNASNVAGEIVGFRCMANGGLQGVPAKAFVGGYTKSANNDVYNFFTSGDAPNYFEGATEIVGTTKLKGSTSAANTDAYIYATRNSSISPRLMIQRQGATSSTENALEVIASTEAQPIQFALTYNGNFTRSALAGDYRLTDYRIFSPTAIQNASQIVSQLSPKLEGFIAHELQSYVPEAVIGTQDAEEAIGTLADYDGTVLETEVTEPSELTYEEEVETDGVATMVIRTRSWSPTGTRDVYQGVDQTKLIPLLTKALQEALERIEALEAQLNP